MRREMEILKIINTSICIINIKRLLEKKNASLHPSLKEEEGQKSLFRQAFYHLSRKARSNNKKNLYN